MNIKNVLMCILKKMAAAGGRVASIPESKVGPSTAKEVVVRLR